LMTPILKATINMLKRCCGAALCLGLVVPTVPTAWAQDKPLAPSTTKPAAAKPKPKASSAQPQKPAAQPLQGAAAEADSAGVKAIEAIFACVAQGLPEGWQRAWVVVTEMSGTGKERTFEGRFTMSLEAASDKRWDFVPCNARSVAEGVYGLNDFLEPEKRQWKVATLLFTPDGKFELKYDYTR